MCLTRVEDAMGNPVVNWQPQNKKPSLELVLFVWTNDGMVIV